MATSHPLCPFTKPQPRTKIKVAGMNTNTYSSVLLAVDSAFSVLDPWPAVRCMFKKKWNMLPAPSFSSCSTSETRTEKRGDLLREVSRPKQSLVGADYHVPKVTSWPNSTSHSFLGGGASRQQGSLSTVQTSTVQCRHCVFVQSNPTAFWPSATSSQLVNPTHLFCWLFRETTLL